MAEYRVARVSELQPGERKIVKVRGIEIGLFRVDDEFFALRNVCPHQFGPVCAGGVAYAIVADGQTNWQPAIAFEGEVVTCPWHGLEFHIRTGRCLAYPDVRLRSYQVRRDGDDLVIKV